MNLSDYQARALETALPTALTTEYLAPMIVGEVGELFGALAKSVRDGWDEERTRKTLTKELGDVAWGVAVLMHQEKLIPFPAMTTEFGADPEDFPDDRIEAMAMLNHVSLTIMERTQKKQSILLLVRILWTMLMDYCELVTGSSFDEVLEANLAKLADRKDRGVIGGSGDER